MLVTVGELKNWLNSYLNVSQYSDIAINDLQLGSEDRPVTTVACAVDASLATFQRAQSCGADFLFVHHGFFWGKPLAITQQHFKRVEFLVKNEIALYASHLPLDVHPISGNNAQLANALDLQERQGFAQYKGISVGVKGRLPAPLTPQDISKKIMGASWQTAPLFSFGPKMVESVAIVSGDMPFAVEDAIKDNIDLFISGEGAHAIYHTALEAGINMLLAGHYHSETFGPKAIAKLIYDTFHLPTHFIDFPTSL